jgi:hypothetical protein
MKKLWNNIKLATALVFNRFEAVVYRWGERSWLGQSYQDARLDVDSASRKELQRRHRYWVVNSPIVNWIRSLFIQFSVGIEGLKVTPNSADEAWNVSRQTSWDAWCRAPEITSRLNLGQVCIQWAGALFDDGEIFVHKISDRGMPKIESIEAHRVETPLDKRTEEGKTIFDGISVDSNGLPVVYWVRDAFDQHAYTAIPAKEIIHIFKARRPGQMRGIPEGFSGMNTLHDYEDLQMLEMQAAKLASAIGNVETNPTGEIDINATRRSRLSISSTNAAGGLVMKNADQFYKVTLGSQHIALKAGDSLKQFQVDRPSVSQQMHWDILLNSICCSYCVPKLLVVPYSVQGTEIRAVLDTYAYSSRINFELVAIALRDIYEWQTRWAVQFDRTMDGTKPQNFLDSIIRPPRAPNVDIGYTAQARQLELQAGTMTIQDIYAERQQDWRQQMRQIAETRAYVKQLAKEFKIEPYEISQIINIKLTAEPGAEEPQPAKQDQKPEPKTA